MENMRAVKKSCNYPVDNSTILSAGYEWEQNHINKNVERIFIIIFYSGKSCVSISYNVMIVWFTYFVIYRPICNPVNQAKHSLCNKHQLGQKNLS